MSAISGIRSDSPGDRSFNRLWEVYGKEGHLHDRCVKILEQSSNCEDLIKIAQCLPRNLGPEQALWVQEHLKSSSADEFLQAADIFEIHTRDAWHKTVADILGTLSEESMSTEVYLRLAKQLPGVTPEEVKEIQHLCGNKAIFFASAYKELGSKPELAKRIADCIGKSTTGTEVFLTARALPEQSPETIINGIEKSGKNARYFPEALKSTHLNSVDIPGRIATSLKESSNPKIFILLVELLPNLPPEDVLEIQRLCGNNSLSFEQVFEWFGKNDDDAKLLAEVLGKCGEVGELPETVELMPDLTPVEFHKLMELDGRNPASLCANYILVKERFPSEPNLLDKVGALSSASYDFGFLKFADELPGFTFDQIADIVEKCHHQYLQFSTAYQALGSHPEQAAEIAMLVGKNHFFSEIAKVLPGKTIQELQEIVSSCGENAYQFTHSFDIFGRDPAIAKELAETLNKIVYDYREDDWGDRIVIDTFANFNQIAKAIPKETPERVFELLQKCKKNPNTFGAAHKIAIEHFSKEQNLPEKITEILSSGRNIDWKVVGLIASTNPEATMNEVISIAATPCKNRDLFPIAYREAAEVLGPSLELAMRVANDLDKGVNWFFFKEATEKNPEMKPDELIEHLNNCGYNADSFSKAFRAFDSDPTLAETIAEALVKSPNGAFFAELATLLPGSTVEQIQNILQKLGLNAGYFLRAFVASGAKPDLVESMVKAFEGVGYSSVLCHLAEFLPELPFETILQVVQKCDRGIINRYLKHDAERFPAVFRALGSKPEMIDQITDALVDKIAPDLMIDMAKSLPEDRRDDIISICRTCGDQRSDFMEVYQALGAKPEYIDSIAEVLGNRARLDSEAAALAAVEAEAEATSSQGAWSRSNSSVGFEEFSEKKSMSKSVIAVASALPDELQERLFEIAGKCGYNGAYFSQIFQKLGSTAESIDLAVELLSLDANGKGILSVVTALPEPTKESVEFVINSCGNHEEYFADLYQALGSDPDQIPIIVETLKNNVHPKTLTALARAMPNVPLQLLLDIHDKCNGELINLAKIYDLFNNSPELLNRIEEALVASGNAKEIPKGYWENVFRIANSLSQYQFSIDTFLTICRIIPNIPQQMQQDVMGNSLIPFEQLARVNEDTLNQIADLEFSKRRVIYSVIEGLSSCFSDTEDPETIIVKAMKFKDVKHISYIKEILTEFKVPFDSVEKLADEKVYDMLRGIQNLTPQSSQTLLSKDRDAYQRWKENLHPPFKEMLPLIVQSRDAYDCLRRVQYGAEFDEAAMEEKYPIEPSNPNWERYVARSKRISTMSEYSARDKQHVFGHMMRQGVQVSAESLKQYGWSAIQLLDYVSERRGKIARHLSHTDVQFFGQIRPSPRGKCVTETKLDTIYHEILERLYAKQRSGTLTQTGTGRMVEGGYHGQQFIANLDGEKIELDSLSVTPKQALIKSSADKLYHTKPSQFPKIFEHVLELYDQARKPLPHEEKMVVLGEIFWWICRGKFWNRGDPSIAEMFVKAIVLADEGIELPPWKEGLIPWVEVIVEPDPETFGRNFHKLFDEVASSGASSSSAS